MSRLYGPVFQTAYVVEDCDAAIRHMVEKLHVGPFFMFPLPLEFEWIELDGERVAKDSDLMSAVALSYSGDVMIEIIQPGRDASPYREFLDSGRSGVHHLGTDCRNYDEAMARARDDGVGVAMEGVLPMSRFSYLRTDDAVSGTMIELIEMKQEMRELFAMIKREAADWDGKDSVRKL